MQANKQRVAADHDPTNLSTGARCSARRCSHPMAWSPASLLSTGRQFILAVGNTVVLKPGDQAPLTMMRIVKLLQQVLHIVPDNGPTTGRHWQRIRRSGSTRSSRSAILTSTRRSPLPEGAFFNLGEVCTAASRLLVHRSIHGEFVRRLCDAVKRLRVGGGTRLFGLLA